MATADVTIRGAGIFGLSIAWECLRRGARVQVIDPYGPGAGSSAGLVGALAPHVPENWNAKKQFQFDSLIAAEAFWRGVEQASGLSPGYARTGRLQPIADDRALALAKARAAGAAALWQGKAAWSVRPAQDFGDWAPISPTRWLIHDTLSARMSPRAVCAALVGALAAQDVRVGAKGPDRGAVIWATGAAGLACLSRELNRPVGNAVKGQSALLQYDARDLPQLFADAVHMVPHADGTVGIGSTSERDFDDPAGIDGLLEDVITRARAACPALADAPVIDRWAGLRPRAKSRAPMLGEWPGRQGHFIANGGFKIGFGMAPKVAAVMADLVLEGSDAIPQGFRVEDNL